MTLKTILSITLILLLKFCIAQQNPKIITVDVSKNDKLNLSEIAEDIIPINLVKLEGFEVIRTSGVIINSDYLFILVKAIMEEDNKEIYQVLQYSIDGKFIRNIEKYNIETNELILPRKIFYDDQSKNILISYHDRSLSTLNSSGELLSTKEKTSIGDFYNNYMWRFENLPDIENNKNWVLLTSASLNGLKKDTIMKYSTDGFQIGKLEVLCNANGKLYFFTDVANFVYSVSKNSAVKKEYEFRFINSVNPRSNLGARRFLFNKYIYYEYMIEGNMYAYLYDCEKGSGLNFTTIKKDPSPRVIPYHPEITDDILNTGYVAIVPTNSPDYIYFIGGMAERKKLNLDIKNPNPFILLVKLK